MIGGEQMKKVFLLGISVIIVLFCVSYFQFTSVGTIENDSVANNRK
jgi:hypothetical protein